MLLMPSKLFTFVPALSSFQAKRAFSLVSQSNPEVYQPKHGLLC
jgi:hypothetical protein